MKKQTTKSDRKREVARINALEFFNDLILSLTCGRSFCWTKADRMRYQRVVKYLKG